MNRALIRETFRAECPEITDRVLSDTLINNWCLDGDKVICAATRCIVDDTTFTSTVSTTVEDTKYDLSALLTKFYDIDTYPGSGIIYDGEKLDETTVASLDSEESGWRDRDAGTPKKFYRRGKYLYFDYPVETASTVRVYYIKVSDDFDSDTATPYNQLSYLEPFHYGMVKYLVWKAKLKVGKPGESQIAQQEFDAYVKFMKKELSGGKYAPIIFKGPTQPTNSYGI